MIDLVPALCQKLAHRAQELSVDTSIDSPFARLAKENDILWSGGIPDDLTVVVSRVTRAVSHHDASSR